MKNNKLTVLHSDKSFLKSSRKLLLLKTSTLKRYVAGTPPDTKGGIKMADIVTSLHLEYNSIANGGDLLLVSMTAVKRYLDGKPTDENDYRCTVVAPKNGFMRYDVIVQNKPEIVLTDGDAIPVMFDGLTLKLYRTWRENTSGGYALSAKATAVRPATKRQ